MIESTFIVSQKMTMIILAFFLTITAFTWVKATEEVIQNGGFEDGTNGWGSMGK